MVVMVTPSLYDTIYLVTHERLETPATPIVRFPCTSSIAPTTRKVLRKWGLRRFGSSFPVISVYLKL